MNNLKHRSKTFVLATIFVFVAVFASSFVNFLAGSKVNIAGSIASACNGATHTFTKGTTVTVSGSSCGTVTTENKSTTYTITANNGDTAKIACSIKYSKPSGIDTYSTTLGWSIDGMGGSSGTTWYKPRSGLPQLRQFMDWTKLWTFKLVFKYPDGTQAYEKEVGEVYVGVDTTRSSSNFSNYNVTATLDNSKNIESVKMDSDWTVNGFIASKTVTIPKGETVEAYKLTFDKPTYQDKQVKNGNSVEYKEEVSTDGYKWNDGSSDFETKSYYVPDDDASITVSNNGEIYSYTFTYISDTSDLKTDTITVSIKKNTGTNAAGYEITSVDETTTWTMSECETISFKYTYYCFTLKINSLGSSSAGDCWVVVNTGVGDTTYTNTTSIPLYGKQDYTITIYVKDTDDVSKDSSGYYTSSALQNYGSSLGVKFYSAKVSFAATTDSGNVAEGSTNVSSKTITITTSWSDTARKNSCSTYTNSASHKSVVCSLDISTTYKNYDYDLGYTVEGSSSNSLSNVTKSSTYKPNGDKSYQDVVKSISGATIGETTLPTTLSDVFGGDDYSDFSGWVVDITALESLGYKRYNTSTQKWYMGGKYSNGVWVYKGWIEFKDGTITTAFNTKQFITGVTKISVLNNFVDDAITWSSDGTWGAEQSGYQGSFKMPIIANFNGNYDVSFNNSINTRNDLNDQERTVKGVGTVSGSVVSYSNSKLLSLSSSTDVNFVYSTGTAFIQGSDSTAIVNSSIYSNQGGFGLFNYGHDIVGYTVSFKYHGVVYYAYADESVGYAWRAQTSNTNNKTAILSKTSLSELLNSFNVWTIGDYVFAGTTINIQPIWQAATIKLKDGDTGFSYLGTYKVERDANTTTVGKSIAYYTTKSGNIVVADDGSGNVVKWDYLDIPQGNYAYNSTSNYYLVTLAPYEVDNIYRVWLTSNVAWTGDEYLTESCDYTIANSSSPSGLKTSGTAQYYDYSNWDNSSYDKSCVVEKYARDFGYQVKDFVYSIDNKLYDLFNKSYTGSGYKYIFVANNHTIGQLTYHRNYYDQIAWIYNCTDDLADETAAAFTTEEYRYNYQPHVDALAPDGYTWTIYEDVSNKAWSLNMNGNPNNPTLMAYYYRQSFALNVETINTLGTSQTTDDYEDFVGYAIISIKDNVENTTSIYLVIYDESSAYATCLYNALLSADGNTVLSTTANDLKKLINNGLAGFNTSGKRIFKLNKINSIIVFAGSEVTMSVIDQSKVEDLSYIESFYDPMIGYKYQNAINCSMYHANESIANAQKQTTKASYDYVINFNTTSDKKLSGLLNGDIDVESGDTILIDILFEPIKYNTTISLTMSGSGRIVLNEQTKGESCALNAITRDSSNKIYYYAFAGYGLNTNSFSLNTYSNALQVWDSSKTNAENQKYVLTLTGAWLRWYYYKNGTSTSGTPYSAAATQNLGSLNINNVLLEFNVKYMVFEGDENVATEALNVIDNGADGLDFPSNGISIASLTGASKSKWSLGDTITWTLTNTTTKDDWGVTYAYYQDGKYYAIFNSWARQYNNINDRTLFVNASDYKFMLTNQPIRVFDAIGTDDLFKMVNTISGVIIPQENRVIHFAMKVQPIYTISMQIAIKANDTNCTNRTFTIQNGNNHSVQLLAQPNHLQSTTKTILTYLGLESSMDATYDERYYTAVKYVDVVSGKEADITSPSTTDRDMTIMAVFTPKELQINLIFERNGVSISQEEAEKDYLFNWILTPVRGKLNGIANSPKAGYVVTNDEITFSYTTSDLNRVVVVTVNGSDDRATFHAGEIYQVGDNGYVDDNWDEIMIYNSDYEYINSIGECGKINITIDIQTKEKNMINLKIVGDNSNGTTFSTDELADMQAFADLYIKGINRGKSGVFVEGYPVKIQFNSIPNGYRYVGLKWNGGNIDTTYELIDDSTILITDGIRPDNMTEEEFSKTVEGIYYAVFQKIIVNAEMTLTEDNKNNYTYSTSSQLAIWNYNKLVLPNGTSVNDTINFSRINDLETEELDYYYYIDKNGNKVNLGKISQLKITNEILDNLSGDYTDNAKTLKLGVESKAKYFVTINIDSTSASYLQSLTINGTACRMTDSLTYVSDYYLKNSTLILNINSINADKYSIKVSGDVEFAGGTIDENLSLTKDLTLTVVITKNEFSLSVEEKLYDDIIEYNLKKPQTLTGENLINKNSDNSSTVDGTEFVYLDQVKLDVATTSGEGENKKDLTQLMFKDENLIITFNLTQSDTPLAVTDKDGNNISDTKISTSENKTTITVEYGDVNYVFTCEKLLSNQIQLTFTGVGNCNLTLNYTSIKLITIS